MNDSTRRPPSSAGPVSSGDDARLRMQLRGLRRDLQPERDLWPQIAARITAPTATVPPARRRSPRAWAPLALAASLLLAIGLAWTLRPLPGPGADQAADPALAASARGDLVPREAEALSLEYHAAMREVRAATPPVAWSPGDAAAAEELDRSAAQIRDAIARDPDASFLLERLRRTYAQRLALTQRGLG